jgi:hypothetical protein
MHLTGWGLKAMQMQQQQHHHHQQWSQQQAHGSLLQQVALLQLASPSHKQCRQQLAQKLQLKQQRQQKPQLQEQRQLHVAVACSSCPGWAHLLLHQAVRLPQQPLQLLQVKQHRLLSEQG